MDETLTKQAKQDGNDTTTLSHPPYILCHFANYIMLCVCCVHRSVVEGNGVCSAACVCSAC